MICGLVGSYSLNMATLDFLSSYCEDLGAFSQKKNLSVPFFLARLSKLAPKQTHFLIPSHVSPRQQISI
jgi:hypothetical protein